MMMQADQSTFAVQEIKSGGVVADLDGTIYKYLGSRQIVEGHDSHGAEYAEVKRVYRCERLLDKRIFRFSGSRKVILLEGEKR
tara:strand:+ start:266 stop:514 length:249 start_codon:yes stop_codon:yes gene_type:complete